MTTKLRQQMGEKLSGSRLPQLKCPLFTQFTPKKHHHLSLPADQGPTVWVVIEWALGKLGPGPNCLPQKSGQLGPGPACDEYIQIFEYIGHKYLFRHSFVSNLFVVIYAFLGVNLFSQNIACVKKMTNIRYIRHTLVRDPTVHFF